jgi:hypothetical protein
MRLLFVAVFVLLVAACGGSGDGTGFGGSNGGSGGAGGGTSSGGAGSSGGAAGSSGGSGSSGSSGGGGNGAAAGQTVTLTMGPFTVPPSTEVFKCQTFANPFGGKDTDVDEYDEQMTTGSHHMFMFFSPGATDGAVEDCPAGGLEFHPYPFGAQTPTSTLTYPAGVGSRIPGTMGFLMNAHFLNVTSQPFQATLTVTLHVAEPGSVKQYAGVMFMNNIHLVIPPSNTPVPASATCTVPQDMYVMQSSAHMHQRATDFVATTGSQTLYTTKDWSSPIPAKYTPPTQLKGGSSVTWTCSYTNETVAPLTFGESAERNVMCIYMMQFYPLADPSNPTIQCQI